MTEETIETAITRKRMAAADPSRSTTDAVAAMAAGAGAELVARSHMTTEALIARQRRWERMTPTQQREVINRRLAK